jgi:hypothetical protein
MVFHGGVSFLLVVFVAENNFTTKEAPPSKLGCTPEINIAPVIEMVTEFGVHSSQVNT